MRAYRVAAVLAAAQVLTLSLTGCVHSPPAAPLPPPGAAGSGGLSPQSSAPVARTIAGLPSGTAASPLTWVLPDPLPGEPMMAVLRGYGAYLDGYVRLYGSPDPADPRIAQVSTGAARRNLVADLRDLAARHRAVRGPITLAPTVTVLGGAIAQVDDCADLSHFGYVGSANVGRPNQPIRAELTWTGDRWLVATVSRPARTCTTTR